MILTLPVRDVLPATPRARILRLDLKGQPFAYRAGQAALLRPSASTHRRPYSIASAPEETARHGWLEFLVQIDRDGSTGVSLADITAGARIEIEGPLGSFQFPDRPLEQRFLFIAGGTGIAPLRSMVQHVLLAERGGRIGLVYSVRTPEDFAYLDQFQQLSSDGRIAFRQTVTRDVPAEWSGRFGRIDAEWLAPMIEPSHTLCFICGPPALLKALPPLLEELGVDANQIKTEQWS